MFKCKITTLSPIHISSGREFELYFNMLRDRDFIYLYDEFKIASFFINKNITILTNYNELKSLIKKYEKEIMKSNIHFRKIENNFEINKPLLEQISTASKPIIAGSSIKGAIRTAYINKLVQEGIFNIEIRKLQEIDDKIYEAEYNEKRNLQKQKKDIIKKINRKIDSETKNIFKYLKISDSINELDTKIYKTINIKKEKSHQANRKEKIEKIANFVEAISINSVNVITIDIQNEYFNNLGNVCNDFYKELYESDFNYYFSKKELLKKFNLSNNKFLLNIGRFGGAELKSSEEIRCLKKTGAEVEWKTSARTYALEKNGNPPYFKNELIPFGWVLCEIIKD